MPDDELVETCWSVAGASTYVFQCGIYRLTGARLEVRVTYNDGLVYARPVRDLDAGRELARNWRDGIRQTGKFHELC
jgi:hypothetical protein